MCVSAIDPRYNREQLSGVPLEPRPENTCPDTRYLQVLLSMHKQLSIPQQWEARIARHRHPEAYKNRRVPGH